jgi:hypothetical protein
MFAKMASLLLATFSVGRHPAVVYDIQRDDSFEIAGVEFLLPGRGGRGHVRRVGRKRGTRIDRRVNHSVRLTRSRHLAGIIGRLTNLAYFELPVR